MLNFIQYFIYIVLGYTIMGMFQYWISDFFYAMGIVIGSFTNVLNGIGAFFNVSVASYVLVLYGSLIFVFIYSLLHKLYLSGRSK